MRRTLAVALAATSGLALAIWSKKVEVEAAGGAPAVSVRVAGMAAEGLARAQREIAAREYRASRHGAGLQAPNRAHALRTWFEPTGIRIHDRVGVEGPALAELRLGRVGRRDVGLVAAAPGVVASEGSRVEIRRPGIVEWYVNGPVGLEQGFTFDLRPAGEGPLLLELEVAGANVQLDGDAIVLASPGGRPLRYAKLQVRDAAGGLQAARLEAPSESRVRLVVEDTGAAYPLVIDPLITSVPVPQIESNQAGALLGTSVAGAGDVNGDGYDDVIVGARLFDAGEQDEGAAFIFPGGANGIADGTPATAATQLESDQANADFGSSVAGAGDLNGDGYDDVIVGAYAYDAGEQDEGAAFIFLGSATGVADGNPATAATQLESNQFDPGLAPGFGGSVAGAGDVNGDGYDDVIVGAVRYNEDRGAAFVFHGSARGVADGNPTTAATRLVSSTQGGWFANSVAGAGDVNADGYGDVIVGAPFLGEAFLFLGSATGIAHGGTATAAARLRAGQNAFFGVSVAGAGDVNADGYDDVVVGAPYDSEADGAAFVFVGSAAGIAPAVAAARLQSSAAPVDASSGGSGGLGWVVAGAGDVNADGPDDVIALAGDGPFVFVDISAGIGSGSPVLAAEQIASGRGLGSHDFASLAGAGDVNGDGYADVIVGSPYHAESAGGAAFVFAGRTCANGVDDDGDGVADYPADPGCGRADDLSERGAACDNGRDDDGDGRTDYPSDPGCTNVADASERSGAACDNGLDDDGDGAPDWPFDPGCIDLADGSERGVAICDNGIDDDGDGAADWPFDPGCIDLADGSERGVAICDNGLDDDADGTADYPADPGCLDLQSARENPPCQDAVDNDGDGTIDFDGGASANHGVVLAPPDLACTSPEVAEGLVVAPPVGCGLGGEAAVPVLALLSLRRWSKRRTP